MLKTVTLQEANGLLPLVREHFWRLYILLTHLHHLRSETQKKSIKRFRFDKSSESLKLLHKAKRSRKFSSHLKEINEVEFLMEKEISQLMRLGAVVKGLFPPHVDFLSMKNNEPIFLCWHAGEEEISHWHQLDDGSPLRHIIEKDYFGPHVVH